jgi:hypothetical protein
LWTITTSISSPSRIRTVNCSLLINSPFRPRCRKVTKNGLLYQASSTRNARTECGARIGSRMKPASVGAVT